MKETMWFYQNLMHFSSLHTVELHKVNSNDGISEQFQFQLYIVWIPNFKVFYPNFYNIIFLSNFHLTKTN